MIIDILIGLAVILIVFAIVVALQPADFRITRSALIPAPDSVVFEQVDDFHKWQAWSPWAKLDPGAKNTFEGANSGQGAILGWSGNNQVGEGRMTIVESRPKQFIRIQLDFFKPFKATHAAEFSFEPKGEQTLVTWSMIGKNNFMAKAFVMFMNCDKMIGGMYEKGLANLKSVTEQAIVTR